MTRYLVTKESIINKRCGWGMPEDIEEFKMKTNKKAIKYFKNKYGPSIDLWRDGFNTTFKTVLKVYELQIAPAYDDKEENIEIIATIVTE